MCRPEGQRDFGGVVSLEEILNGLCARCRACLMNTRPQTSAIWDKVPTVLYAQEDASEDFLVQKGVNQILYQVLCPSCILSVLEHPSSLWL